MLEIFLDVILLLDLCTIFELVAFCVLDPELCRVEIVVL
jgi:hypothetical protein